MRNIEKDYSIFWLVPSATMVALAAHFYGDMVPDTILIIPIAIIATGIFYSKHVVRNGFLYIGVSGAEFVILNYVSEIVGLIVSGILSLLLLKYIHVLVKNYMSSIAFLSLKFKIGRLLR